MTEKELHKLKRQDLLQLLLMQSKEVTQQQSVLEEQEATLAELRETNARLRARLNEKDEQIQKLIGRLDGKDAEIADLRTRLESTAQEPASELSAELRERLDALSADLETLLKERRMGPQPAHAAPGMQKTGRIPAQRFQLALRNKKRKDRPKP